MRLSANLTQEEAAAALSIKRSTVSMWETGESLPRASLLPRIAALYGCTVDELLADAGDAGDGDAGGSGSVERPTRAAG
jgi:transcriptional regulator with XRE-family HTH domain